MVHRPAPRTVPLTETRPQTSILQLVRLSYPSEFTCPFETPAAESLGFDTLRDRFDTISSRPNFLATPVIFLVRSTPRAYRLAISMVQPLQSNKASACGSVSPPWAAWALGELILMSGFRVVAQSPAQTGSRPEREQRGLTPMACAIRLR